MLVIIILIYTLWSLVNKHLLSIKISFFLLQIYIYNINLICSYVQLFCSACSSSRRTVSSDDSSFVARCDQSPSCAELLERKREQVAIQKQIVYIKFLKIGEIFIIAERTKRFGIFFLELLKK